MMVMYVLCMSHSDKVGTLTDVLNDDIQARRTQLATHESLKLMAHPSSLYEVCFCMGLLY